MKKIRYLNYILPLIITIVYLFRLNAYSKVELPEVPKRPPLQSLKKSLSNISKQDSENNSQYEQNIKHNKNNNEIKIKNFPNQNKSYRLSSGLRKPIAEAKLNYDCLYEKQFNLSYAQLFSLSLNAIKSLDLSLKSFDSTVGEIIAADSLRNTIVIKVLNGSHNDTKVKIIGYPSKIGKIVLKKNLKKVLAALSEK